LCRVVGKERTIVPTGLLTGTRRVGQKQPVVVAYIGGEQQVGLPCRRTGPPNRWASHAVYEVGGRSRRARPARFVMDVGRQGR
jgi:hypothetical protein